MSPSTAEANDNYSGNYYFGWEFNARTLIEEEFTRVVEHVQYCQNL